MDRTRASEACDVGSIPAGGTINAKSVREIINTDLGNDEKDFLSFSKMKDGKLIVNIPGTGNDFSKHEIVVEVR